MYNRLPNTKLMLTGAVFFEAKYRAGAEVYVPPRPFSSLTMRVEGLITVANEDMHFTSDADSLTFIPRGFGYRTRILQDGMMRVMHFYTAENTPDFALNPICKHPTSPLAFHNRFAAAITRYTKEDCDCSVMSDAYRLLSDATELFFNPPPAPPSRIIRCREYIDENLTDPALRIGEIAKLAAISEVYLRREFIKYFGISPIAYIKKRRIEIACHLLSTGIYSVTEVAMRSGFDSISYFSAEFRRMVGATPAQYRQRFGKA